MRRLMAIALVVLLAGWIGRVLLRASDERTVTVQIISEDSVSFNGLAFYQLVTTEGERITVSVDADPPRALAQILHDYNGQRVLLTITPLQVERLER